MSSYDGSWGPSHEYRAPPGRHRGRWKRGAFALTVIGLYLLSHRLAGPDKHGALGWTIHTMTRDGLILGVVFLLARGLLTGRLRLPLARRDRSPATRRSEQIVRSPHPGEEVRALSRQLGGGAFLGLSPTGRWVTADPEHAVMVLGPPRSGKTSSVVIPSLLAAPGAALSTSTKPDVMDATRNARSELGQVWLFDPSGEQTRWPTGVRRLCWSPVAAAGSWDGALLMARAMAATSPAGRGTSNEQHWTERSAALLAPLLHAASLTHQPIAEVLRWVLRNDLDPAGKALEDHHAEIANDVLIGIARTDQRERSSIFSATAGILAAYNADTTRKAAANPNFDPDRFAASTDTVYITAPAHKQALCAPLIVGLLEQIRHATYKHAQTQPATPPVFFCLDEIANIAPIPDLPTLASEAGGQHLHILACLQDLSQARTRWGQDTADGFLSLFQTKLILTGIADTRTLEAISLTLGEYDRHLISHTITHSHPEEHFATHTNTESTTYHTQRHRTLNPGDIAKLPHNHALLLHGTHYGLLRLTPAHRTQLWTAVASLKPNPGSGRAIAAPSGATVRA
jgi:type IV secretion system protein VirD4